MDLRTVRRKPVADDPSALSGNIKNLLDDFGSAGSLTDQPRTFIAGQLPDTLRNIFLGGGDDFIRAEFQAALQPPAVSGHGNDPTGPQSFGRL